MSDNSSAALVHFIVLAVACLVLASCGSGVQRGVVVDVQGDLTSVQQFTVLTDGGERVTVVPDPELDYAFPLPHLREHLQTGEPVVFTSQRRNGANVLLTIDDG